jgi:hypothetical protein
MKGRRISNQLKASDPVIDIELPLLRCSTFGSAKVWPHRRSHKMERQEIKKI